MEMISAFMSRVRIGVSGPKGQGARDVGRGKWEATTRTKMIAWDDTKEVRQMGTFDHRRSSLFLLAAGSIGLLFFALPLLLSPLRWATRLRWRVPEDTDLTVYLGRSLGALATAVSVFGLLAARDPRSHRIVFPMTALAASLLTGVHVLGAIQKKQPWTETAEVLFWGGMAAGAMAAYPRESEE
jgi:hypothetical protein